MANSREETLLVSYLKEETVKYEILKFYYSSKLQTYNP